MKIASRNVNGIRSILQKGFFDRVKSNDLDIVCLQEVKAFENQIPPEIPLFLPDYDYVWHQGIRPWYAGTAIFFRLTPFLKGGEGGFTEKKSDFHCELFHEDGRLTQLNFTFNDTDIALLNIYFPNWWARADGTEMLSYKLDFYTKYREYMHELEKSWKLVISTGDFNICHRPIDIARPEENKNSIWFLPIERAEMDKLEDEHFVDVFRYFNPDLADQYTWRSYRAWARSRNVGWRLDYFWVSQDILPFIKSVSHQTSQQGSDHCPILIEIW